MLILESGVTSKGKFSLNEAAIFYGLFIMVSYYMVAVNFSSHVSHQHSVSAIACIMCDILQCSNMFLPIFMDSQIKKFTNICLFRWKKYYCGSHDLAMKLIDKRLYSCKSRKKVSFQLN